MVYIFSWVPAYENIAQQLLSYRNRQGELIQLLKHIGADVMDDEDSPGHKIPLSEIDPFTFICHLNKYGDFKRKQLLRNLCAQWNIPIEINDVNGIPSANAQRLWLYPFKYSRTNNEIDRLWNFYECFMADTLNDQLFADVLKIQNVGKQKITEVMFTCKVSQYLCLNSVVKPYLNQVHQINTDFTTYTELQSLLTKIRLKVGQPFHVVSYEADMRRNFKDQPVNYYRIGSTDGEGKSMLPEMIRDKVISVGWWDLGDIEQLDPINKTSIQQALQGSGYKPDDNKVASRKAGEILTFYEKIKPFDIAVVVEGQQVKAIGRVYSSNYVYNEDNEFPHSKVVEWFDTQVTDLKISEGLNTSVVKLEYPETIQAIQSYLTKKKLYTPQKTKPTMDSKELPSLNTILFGPPGTGKTFSLQALIDNHNLIERNGGEINYGDLALQYKWWEIVAIALFDWGNASVPELINHPLIKAKYSASSIKSLNARLWNTLQNNTVDTCPNVKLKEKKGANPIFYKESDSSWRIDNEKEFSEIYPDLVDETHKIKSKDESQKSIFRHYTFVTCHQSLSYEDFIEGIKPHLEDENSDENNENVSYSIRKGLFYLACEKAAIRAGFASLNECFQTTKEERAEKFKSAIDSGKVHFIFLDEVNRCNISAVFGELITLIEEDKRLGAKHEIADIVLPYSQKPFGVPANLFIVATMNTADRSVEALDTALRRRFYFSEMLPIPKLIETEGKLKDTKGVVEGLSLTQLLTTMNDRIEVLLNKDHLIGHSYFIEVENLKDLKAAFQHKINPLLQEYFYGDFGKIGLVLGKAFFIEESLNTTKGDDFFAELPEYETSELLDRRTYKLKNVIEMSDEEFRIALNKLLRK